MRKCIATKLALEHHCQSGKVVLDKLYTRKLKYITLKNIEHASMIKNSLLLLLVCSDLYRNTYIINHYKLQNS